MLELNKERPKVVSLVALGASKLDFLNETALTGNPRGMADEVWVINKLGVLFKHDMLFRMDDLRTTYTCNVKSYKGGNVPDGLNVHDTYDDFLKTHDKPIMTSKAYSEYPTSVSYPLEEIINFIGTPYFRTTPAYAVAFAMYLGVKQLRLYGCDYNYPTNKYKAEAGRANMEWMIAKAMDMGMDIFIAPTSSLMDNCIPNTEMMYGYANPMDIKLDTEEDKYKVIMRPEVGKKMRDKKKLKEKNQLQKLLNKYKDEVVRDFITGKFITKEDIDRVETENTKQQKSLGASSKKKTTPKSRKKEMKNDKSKKVHKRRK